MCTPRVWIALDPPLYAAIKVRRFADDEIVISCAGLHLNRTDQRKYWTLQYFIAP